MIHYLLDADPHDPRRLYATESSSSSGSLHTSTVHSTVIIMIIIIIIIKVAARKMAKYSDLSDQYTFYAVTAENKDCLTRPLTN